MKKSLRGKFLLIVLILVIIPLLSVSIFSYRASREALIKTVAAENTIFASIATKGIRNQVLSYRSFLESAISPILHAETLEGKKEIIQGYKEGFISIESLAILDEKGREVVRTDNEPLKDFSNKPQFYRAKEEGSYISWLRYNEEKALSSITISVSLLEKGEFKGVLVAEIFLHTVWDQAMVSALSIRDSAYIFTQKGQLVAEIIPSVKRFQSDQLKEIALDNALEAKVISGEQDTKVGRMLVTAYPISVLNWELVIFRPITEIYGAIYTVRNNVIIISILSLIFVSLVTVFSTKLFVGPIRKLHKGAEIIGKGNLDYRVKIKTGDEIEQLAKEFNRMAESLGRSHTALEESKTVLEIKVKARTKELRELAESLEDKVEERTKTLQERIEELEKFHRLTVGRELKMREMKEKIKEMETQLKKSQS